MAYTVSLILGGIGFISTAFFHSQYGVFASFLLIGAAWAAMLALPFTILTNSLKGGHMGTYLGLFNCTICLPQIIAAAVGGLILGLFTTPGQLAPEVDMLVLAGILLLIGSAAVWIIKDHE
jgi:maltose/moltooligosaccharide transporter